MQSPSLNLIFKYALCFNGYNAFGGIERLAELANERLFFFAEHGLWMGSARELRGCLFFEQRRWSHFGYSPEASDLETIEKLFQHIQLLVMEGDFAPNDGPQANVHGSPPITVDGTAARLLEWRQDEGLLLTVALDASGLVVERRCPPTAINPDDRRLLSQASWLFNRQD